MRAIRNLRRLWRRDNGSATIEFVILFPFFIAVFSSGFEAALLSGRQVLLASATERTVRNLQLGNMGNPSLAELKQTICNTAGFIPDCTNSLTIELERVSTADFAYAAGQVQCIDKDEDIVPAQNFTLGAQNDLMLITVCAAVRPMVPLTGLGLKLPKINNGNHYGLVTFSAFVNEPA